MLVLAGACSPLRVKGYFEPIGVYGGTTSNEPIVAAAGEVQVFMRTAPQGFTLTNNEVEVLDGYGHRILGTVVVKYNGGDCQIGDAGTRELVAAMQDAARAAGANAVVYARSDWDESTAGADRCGPPPFQAREYAWGWAVVLAR